MTTIDQVLSKTAKALADVGEGVACAGTALESTTFTVNGKAFLFLDAKNARLKLAESAAEARALAESPEAAVKIGAGGWTTIRLTGGVAPKETVLRRWVAESHALFHRPSSAPPVRKKTGANKTPDAPKAGRKKS